MADSVYSLILADLQTIMPIAGRNALNAYTYLEAYMKQYEINTNRRAAAFLAQVAVESGELHYVRELASGLEYEGRKDLGNTENGDGVKFKGRGYIQITGRANYANLSKSFKIDFITQPELLEQTQWASRSACDFWASHGLNDLADKDMFTQITKRINGGTTALALRKTYWAKAKTVLGVANG